MLLGRRTAAFGTDILILFAVLAPTSVGIQRLFQITPESGPAVWRAAVLSFSLPSWMYFILSDSARDGATLGKRLWRIQVTNQHGHRVRLGRAIGRNAIKLLPWELTHLVFVFASSAAVINQAQTIVLVLANVLLLLYFTIAMITRGRQSLHDLVMRTIVLPWNQQS